MLMCRQGRTGQVDVEIIVDPLRQIVPTLLDIPYTATDDALSRPASDDDQLATTTQQHDSSRHATEEDTPAADTLSSDAQRDTVAAVSSTAESADELKSSADPVESTSDTSSVPNVTSESDTGTKVAVGDIMSSDQT